MTVPSRKNLHLEVFQTRSPVRSLPCIVEVGDESFSVTVDAVPLGDGDKVDCVALGVKERGEVGGFKLNEPGIGFGLYLTREIIESYGGDLDIYNGESVGAVVQINLETAD